MNKSKIVIIIESSIICILAVLLMILYVNPYGITTSLIRKPSERNQLLIEYGDNFNGFDLFTVDGIQLNQLPTGKVSVVTYLSDTCTSCADVLADFNRFRAVFGDSINYSVIWAESIPKSLINKYNVDMDNNYSLSNKCSLSLSTPTFYILDEHNKVLFKDVERVNLIKKMIEMDIVGEEALRDNATAYIAKEYFGVDDANDFDNKLIYFYMPGCPDCANADALFKDNPLPEFDWLYIYKYDSVGDDIIVDKDKLFVSVYGITWYPSFLVVRHGSVKIVGEVPMEKLIDEITK